MFPAHVVDRVMGRWEPEGDCWISGYGTGSHGYSHVGWRVNGVGYASLAHRIAWSAANGRPIPAGMTVDHICHVRRCINPAHLRLLSNVDNARDNGKRAARTAVPTGRKCGRGHDYVRSPAGNTYCRECNNECTQRTRRRTSTKGQ